MTMNAVPAAFGLSGADISGVLQAASLAPSLHNSQPWRFRILSDQIELHAELERSLPATDPEGRELRLRCGAGLLNPRVAPRAHRARPLLTFLPTGHRARARAPCGPGAGRCGRSSPAE